MSERDANEREAGQIRIEYARRARDERLRRYYARIRAVEERAHRRRLDRTIAFLDGLGPRDRIRVLDLGCGTGRDLAYLAEHGFRRLAGVDLLSASLSEARTRVRAAALALANGAELPFADGAFDAVLQTTALSSIVDPGVRARVAAEIARVTRPGGLIVSYDMRVVRDRNPRLVGIGRAEVARLFGAFGSLSLELEGLDLGIASRLPGPLRALASRVPLLLRAYRTVVSRAVPAALQAEVRAVYRGYDDTGHARRWTGATPGDVLMNDERERWIVTALGPAATGVVVDVGCGDGNVARALERSRGRPERYVGIDLLPGRLADARARTAWAQLAQASAERLPLADAAADAVVASTLFSSLGESWQRAAAAREMARVIRPGGRVVVYDLRYPSPSNRAVRPVSAAELRQLFPGFRATVVRSLTVLPPLARSGLFGGRRRYAILSRIPMLRSHLALVLEKPR